MMIIAPMSSVTPLLLVEMVVEGTKEEEPMGMSNKKIWRKKIWRRTILEPDDESGVEQMPL